MDLAVPVVLGVGFLYGLCIGFHFGLLTDWWWRRLVRGLELVLEARRKARQGQGQEG